MQEQRQEAVAETPARRRGDLRLQRHTHTAHIVTSSTFHVEKPGQSAPHPSPAAGSSAGRSDCPCPRRCRRRIARTETPRRQPEADGENRKPAVSALEMCRRSFTLSRGLTYCHREQVWPMENSAQRSGQLLQSGGRKTQGISRKGL